MTIKTIRNRLDNAASFDDMVNQALKEGWRLIKREVINPGTSDKHIMLYAELVKLDPEPEPPEINPVDAMHIVQRECYKHESCKQCPLTNYCQVLAPCNWVLPEVKA